MSMAESNNCQLSDTCISHSISYNNRCRLVVHLCFYHDFLVLFSHIWLNMSTEINRNEEEQSQSRTSLYKN